EKNRGKELAQSRAYRAANSEKVRATLRRWYGANPEKRHGYYEAHRDEILSKARIRMRAYRQTHPDQYREWIKANPEKRQAYRQRRRANKKNAPVNDFTPAQWEEMKRAYDHRCVYCGRKMERLTQDHILPLSKGGAHT